MSVQPLQTSEIEVGLQGNKISSHTDGSLIFRDRLVPGVRLIDLLNGGEVVIDPSVTINVSASDWVFDHFDPIGARNYYKLNIYFGYTGQTSFASTSITPEDTWQPQTPNEIFVSTTVNVSGGLFVSPITFEEVLIGTSEIRLTSTQQINCNVRIKRI